MPLEQDPRTLSREQYDDLEFDHRQKIDGGSSLHDESGKEIGRLYHEGTISDALKSDSLRYEGGAFDN